MWWSTATPLPVLAPACAHNVDDTGREQNQPAEAQGESQNGPETVGNSGRGAQGDLGNECRLGIGGEGVLNDPLRRNDGGQADGGDLNNAAPVDDGLDRRQIGRASCRERV